MARERAREEVASLLRDSDCDNSGGQPRHWAVRQPEAGYT